MCLVSSTELGIKITIEPNCIPVGCIPFASVAISGGGGVWPRAGEGVWHNPLVNIITDACVKTLPCRNYIADGRNCRVKCFYP